MILSMCSIPLISLCLPGLIRTRPNACWIPLVNISLTKEDFPLPLTPLTQMKVPSGKSTVTFFRLLQAALTTRSLRPFPLRRVRGTSMRMRPLR